MPSTHSTGLSVKTAAPGTGPHRRRCASVPGKELASIAVRQEAVRRRGPGADRRHPGRRWTTNASTVTHKPQTQLQKEWRSIHFLRYSHSFGAAPAVERVLQRQERKNVADSKLRLDRVLPPLHDRQVSRQFKEMHPSITTSVFHFPTPRGGEPATIPDRRTVSSNRGPGRCPRSPETKRIRVHEANPTHRAHPRSHAPWRAALTREQDIGSCLGSRPGAAEAWGIL